MSPCARTKVREIGRDTQRKYLVEWSLHLGRDELAKMSSQPAALDKALNYVQSLAKESEFKIFRIIPMEELTRFTPPTKSDTPAPVNPSGIAIVKAGHLEEAREMIEEWVTGLSYGRISVREYLEYEIKPLEEIVAGGKEQR